MKEIFLSHCLRPSISVLNENPRLIGEYNGVDIILSGTDTGKTTTAEKIGEVTQNMTVKRAIGFGTAEKPSYGVLNNKNTPMFIDEVQENTKKEKDEDFNLSSLWGTGYQRNDSGAFTVHCKFYHRGIYLGNTRDRADPLPGEMLEIFKNTLKKVTETPEQMGKRFGIIIFDKNLRGIGKERSFEKNYNLMRKLKVLFNQVIETSKKNYTLFLLNQDVRNWLNNPYPRELVDKVKNLREAIGDEVFYEFLANYDASSTRVRGRALSRACMDFLGDLLKDKELDDEKVREILEKADEYFDFFWRLNLTSLEHISVASQSGVYVNILNESLAKHMLNVKVLVYAVKRFIDGNEVYARGKEFSMVLLKGEIDKKLKSLGKTTYNFGHIESAIKKNVRILDNLENYSIGTRILNDEILLRIKLLPALNRLKMDKIEEMLEEESEIELDNNNRAKFTAPHDGDDEGPKEQQGSLPSFG